MTRRMGKNDAREKEWFFAFSSAKTPDHQTLSFVVAEKKNSPPLLFFSFVLSTPPHPPSDSPRPLPCATIVARSASFPSGRISRHPPASPVLQRGRRRHSGARPCPSLPSLPATGGGRRLETDGVPRSDLEAVEAAVDAAGGRVTVGDVAAAAGLPLTKAEAALAALAADVAGSALQVSSSGEVVYSLPPGFRASLRAKSAVLRLAPAFDAVAAASGAAVRVAFGAALIASVALVWAALTAAALAAEDGRDNRGGGGRGRGLPISFYFSPADIFWYFDPAPYRRESARGRFGNDEKGKRPQQMSFLAAVFSFVFGDQDPNLTFDQERWAAVGAAIKRNGGVMTAEQLAPYLDLPFGAKEAAEINSRDDDDESFVVPALVRFGGHAEVDERGRLLYTFPSLMATAARAGSISSSDSSSSLNQIPSSSSSVYRSGPLRQQKQQQQKADSVSFDPPPLALERPIPFTLASPGQRLAAAALGAANTAGVVMLGRLLADRYSAAALARSGFGFVGGLYPFLAVYAFSYWLIPGVRWLLAARRNAGVEQRNAAREAAANAVAAPTRRLAEKISSARTRAARVVVGEGGDDEIVFDSEKSDLAGLELEAFDAKLRGAKRERRGGGDDEGGRSFSSFLGQ